MSCIHGIALRDDCDDCDRDNKPVTLRFETKGMAELRALVANQGVSNADFDTFKNVMVVLNRNNFQLIKKVI